MGCSGSKNAAGAPAAPAAAAPEGDFKLTLERADAAQAMGLLIVASTDPVGIQVQAVKEDGLVPTYNKQYESTPEQQVKSGDIIVAINSVFGDFELMKKEFEQQKLSLTLRRPAAIVQPAEEQPNEGTGAPADAAETVVVTADVKAEVAPAEAAPAEAAPAAAAPTEVAPALPALAGEGEIESAPLAEEDAGDQQKTSICC
eukprot:TRINITY_DN19282_c0_g1_i1.p1 TRINITY_DN19282_c0_g1~~TRINITY_DN19282_c0_g1_i1.p1  ORF type:complete len:222 (-),score=62.31 TRINITY_DN19282_c0_g1_i1:289-891(-)